ncbi:hypothetical protein FRX31_013202 [Thalictrum thalictroides]|uniref:Uncharacterized protein n=1 Tax=Thalictrum thalictroides TaxID=46969 RepID=A0A7J6WIL7_THATH|nr:hypothetical protein FRX31_013202 [Thalictrum thalictroides]
MPPKQVNRAIVAERDYSRLFADNRLGHLFKHEIENKGCNYLLGEDYIDYDEGLEETNGYCIVGRLHSFHFCAFSEPSDEYSLPPSSSPSCAVVLSVCSSTGGPQLWSLFHQTDVVEPIGSSTNSLPTGR